MMLPNCVLSDPTAAIFAGVPSASGGSLITQTGAGHEIDHAFACFVLSRVAMMAACASMGGTNMSGDSTVTEATAKQLGGDVPRPPDAIIKQQKSLVMESGNTRTGRVGPSV